MRRRSTVSETSHYQINLKLRVSFNFFIFSNTINSFGCQRIHFLTNFYKISFKIPSEVRFFPSPFELKLRKVIDLCFVSKKVEKAEGISVS